MAGTCILGAPDALAHVHAARRGAGGIGAHAARERTSLRAAGGIRRCDPASGLVLLAATEPAGDRSTRDAAASPGASPNAAPAPPRAARHAGQRPPAQILRRTSGMNAQRSRPGAWIPGAADRGRRLQRLVQVPISPRARAAVRCSRRGVAPTARRASANFFAPDRAHAIRRPAPARASAERPVGRESQQRRDDRSPPGQLWAAGMDRPRPRSTPPAIKSSTDSAENVENVVSAPRKPVMQTSRHSGAMRCIGGEERHREADRIAAADVGGQRAVAEGSDSPD